MRAHIDVNVLFDRDDVKIAGSDTSVWVDRALLTPMSPDAAFAIAARFTDVGMKLQELAKLPVESEIERARRLPVVVSAHG